MAAKRNRLLLIVLIVLLVLCLVGAVFAFVSSFSSWKAGPRLGDELYTKDGELLGFVGDGGAILAITDLSRKVSVWDVATGEHLADYDRPSPGHQPSFRHNGQALVVTDPSIKTLAIMDAQTGVELLNFDALQYYAPVYSPIFNADGSRIYGLRPDGSLVRIEIDEFDELEPAGIRVGTQSNPPGQHVTIGQEVEIQTGLDAAGLGITPVAPRYQLSVSISFIQAGTCDYTDNTTDTLYRLDSEATLVDLETGEKLGQDVFEGEALPKCSPIKPANWGNNIQTGRISRKLYSWVAGVLAGRPGTNISGFFVTPLPELISSQEEIAYERARIALSADEQYLFAYLDHRAFIWDLSLGKFLREVEYGSVFTPTPDGQSYLVVLEDKYNIFLYDIASGQEKIRFTGDFGPVVSSAVFSADGKYLVTSGHQGLIVWDVLNGKELFRVGEGRFLDRAFFSQNNSWLAAGDILEFTVWELENTGQ